MSRLKATTYTTRAQFDAACNEIAVLEVQLRQQTALRDQHLQQIRDQFGPMIDDLTEERDAKVALAEKYAETHRAELFPAARKSGETPLSNYGFRTGNPTLALLNRKWSWASVLEAVKAAFPKRYVRQTEAVDKDAIKAQLTAEQLATVGLRVTQSEAFYIEAKDQPAAAGA